MPARRILVPLLVLAVAAALYLWNGPGATPIVDLPDDARVCAERLRAIHAGLLAYKQREGRLPGGSGPAWLEGLITDGVWPDEPEARLRLSCPATTEPYAARDTLAFPLAKFPSGGPEREPLASCGAGRGHDGRWNVLHSDGSVVTLVLAHEIERGTLPAGTTTLSVGPGSPVPDLRKLSAR